jgi:hypothetical protein
VNARLVYCPTPSPRHIWSDVEEQDRRTEFLEARRILGSQMLHVETAAAGVCEREDARLVEINAVVVGADAIESREIAPDNLKLRFGVDEDRAVDAVRRHDLLPHLWQQHEIPLCARSPVPNHGPCTSNRDTASLWTCPRIVVRRAQRTLTPSFRWVSRTHKAESW